MKNQVLTFALMVIMLPFASAQITKGSVVGGINGNLNLEGSSSGSFRSAALNTDLYGLYFIGNNFGLGLESGMYYSRVRMKGFTGSYNDRALILEIGPVARKYFGSGKLTPYLHLGTGVGISSVRYNNNGVSEKPASNVGFYIRPAVGLTYWLNNRVGIDATIGKNILEKHHHSLQGKLGVSVRLGK